MNNSVYLKKFLKIIIPMMMVIMLVGCNATKNEDVVNSNQTEIAENINQPEIIEETNTESIITKEMAYEGVNNYCHSEYDWSVAEDNPDIMYVNMGEESETEYQVVFRSYTGAFVYFYVDKSNGNTRIIESVPTLDVEEEVGTINLYDYLKDND